jgi:hypothetical protein
MSRQKNNVLRVYNVYIDGLEEEGGLAFAAYTTKDARRFAWNEGETSILTDRFLDLRTNWIPKANTEGMKEGQKIELLDGLRRGVYLFSVHEETCPLCHQEEILYGCQEEAWAGCLECACAAGIEVE